MEDGAMKRILCLLVLLLIAVPAQAWERGAGVGVGTGSFDVDINSGWKVHGSGMVFTAPIVLSQFVEYRLLWGKGQFNDVQQKGEIEFQGMMFGEKDKVNTLTIDIRPSIRHEVLLMYPLNPITPVFFCQQYVIPVEIKGKGRYAGSTGDIKDQTFAHTFRATLVGGGLKVFLIQRQNISGELQLLVGNYNTMGVTGRFTTIPFNGISVGAEVNYEEFSGYNMTYKGTNALVTAQFKF